MALAVACDSASGGAVLGAPVFPGWDRTCAPGADSGFHTSIVTLLIAVCYVVGGVFRVAGRGPAPKREQDRARRNKDAPPLRLVELLDSGLVLQPELPEFQVRSVEDGHVVLRDFVWPDRTRDWWAMWAASPLSDDFTASDWDFLLDTAVLHARFWQGDFKVAPELRLRVAKFGQTPEDRLRLRIEFSPPPEPAPEFSGRLREGGSRSRGRRATLREVS